MMRSRITGNNLINTLRDYNIFVSLRDLDGETYGLVRKYGDGYLIFIEHTLCFDMIIETLQHEILHILLGHLDDDIKTEQQKETEVAEELRKIKKENENDLSKMFQ